MEIDGRTLLFSFMGIDRSKSYAGITDAAFMYDTRSRRWAEMKAVPGGAGRIGSTAQAVMGRIYIFGGFSVDRRLREKTSGRVDIYDPRSGSYSSGAPIPIPVDDAVSGVWREEIIYLISGWSGDRTVRNVQFYDLRLDRWGQATPVPGPPVFGHAGGIVGDTIIFCDGVETELREKPTFVLSDRCFRGDIDSRDPSRILWSRISAHPGRPLYRMAAGVFPAEGLVVFTGGGDTPYNYNGIGYDGEPSRSTADTFLYDIPGGRWVRAADKSLKTMDHRNLAGDGRTLFLVGGMTGRQQVTDRVHSLSAAGEGGITEQSGAGPGP